MKDKDMLDKLFREKLGNEEASVPESSWNSISQKLNQNKHIEPKRVILPFSFLRIAMTFLGGSLFGLLVFYVYDLKKENEALYSIVTSINQNENTGENAISDSIFIDKSSTGDYFIAPLNDSKAKKSNSNSQDIRIDDGEVDNFSYRKDNGKKHINLREYSTSYSHKNTANNYKTSPELFKNKSKNYNKQKRNSSKVAGNIIPGQNTKSLTKKDFHSEQTSSVPKSELISQNSPKVISSEKSFDSENLPGKVELFRKPNDANDKNSSTLQLSSQTTALHGNVVSHVNDNNSIIAFPDTLLHSQNDPSNSIEKDNKTLNQSNNSYRSVTINKSSDISQDSLNLPKFVSSKTPTLDSLKLDSKSIEKSASSATASVKNKEKNIFGRPFSVGIFLAPEIASRSINMSTHPDQELEFYKKGDKVKFGFSSGVSVDLYLPKNFFLRTGLNYWNVGEKNAVVFNYVSNNNHKIVNSISNSSDTLSQYDPQGYLGNELSGIKVPEAWKKFSSTISNNYHYLGLPVVIGKKLNNNKLSFGMFSGLISNVLLSPSKAVYYVHNDASNPEVFIQEKRGLSRLNLVYWGGIDVEYAISDVWLLSLSPNVKYSLTSIYKDKNTVKQLPYSFGMQAGLKYRFGS